MGGVVIEESKLHEYHSWDYFYSCRFPVCFRETACSPDMLNGLIFLMRGLWADFSEHWFTAAIIAWFLVAGVDLLYIEKAGGIKNS